jgi:chemotaxis protein methyltransferase CheR
MATTPPTAFGTSATSGGLLGSGAKPSFHHIVFVGERQQRRPGRASNGGLGARAALAVPADQLDRCTAEWFGSIGARGGVEISRYRPSVLRRRQGACLRALRGTSHFESGSPEGRSDGLIKALDALLIGVTDFFRDHEVFAALARELPALWKSRTHSERQGGLRVLSAGCSTGAELYSIAMLMAERGIFRVGKPAELCGVDCRPHAIAAAQAGIYSAAALKGLEPSLRDRYCEMSGSDYRIIDPLRMACRWHLGDIFQEAGEAEDLDLILCRNLAIYLEHAASCELWQRLSRRLRPGGILMLGKAERPASAPELVRIGPCLYRKMRGAHGR